MKIDNYEINKSSFLSVEKDMSIIIEKMLSNDRLKKLLYYETSDALEKTNLDRDQSLSLINSHIKIVPKINVDAPSKAYVLITFDDFLTNYTNPEFRDNTIGFHILCHYDAWLLKDFQLRPYKIAAEIDSMYNNKHLTGIGKLNFAGGKCVSTSDEFAGITLFYRAIHGNEDKIHALSPQEEKILFGEEE